MGVQDMALKLYPILTSSVFLKVGFSLSTNKASAKRRRVSSVDVVAISMHLGELVT